MRACLLKVVYLCGYIMSGAEKSDTALMMTKVFGV